MAEKRVRGAKHLKVKTKIKNLKIKTIGAE